MATIISIGYSDFLLKNDKDAATVMRSMAGAVELDHKFHNKRLVYWCRDSQPEISMRTATPGNIMPREPIDADAEVDGSPQYGLVKKNYTP